MPKSPLFHAISNTAFIITSLNLATVASPIHDAAYHNNVLRLKELIAEVSVDVLDQNGNTLLSCALRGEATEALSYLFTLHPTVDTPHTDGTTPLFIAATSNNCKAMKQLLERGANPHHENDDQWTAATQAVYGNKIETLKILLAHALTPPHHSYSYQQPSLEKLCGLFFVKQWHHLDEKERCEIAALDNFTNLLLEIQLESMKKMLLQETKQRGNCLKIAHDENHVNLETFLHSIMSAQTFLDIKDIELHQLVKQALQEYFSLNLNTLFTHPL